MDPERKKALKKAFKERELDDAKSKMCLSRNQLEDLLDYLDSSLGKLAVPCDHTLSRTQAWAGKEGLETARVLASVREFGGYCDCEVLCNVTPDKFGWEKP